MMELLSVDYFRKKTPSKMSESFLNMPTKEHLKDATICRFSILQMYPYTPLWTLNRKVNDIWIGKY